MEQKPARMDVANMVHATYRAQERERYYVEIAERIITDPEKENRLCVRADRRRNESLF